MFKYTIALLTAALLSSCATLFPLRYDKIREECQPTRQFQVVLVDDVFIQVELKQCLNYEHLMLVTWAGARNEYMTQLSEAALVITLRLLNEKHNEVYEAEFVSHDSHPLVELDEGSTIDMQVAIYKLKLITQ